MAAAAAAVVVIALAAVLPVALAGGRGGGPTGGGTRGGGTRGGGPDRTASATPAQVRTWARTVGTATTAALTADYQALISQGAGGSGAQACSALGVEARYAVEAGGPPAEALRRTWMADLRLVSTGAAACREQVGADDQRTATGPVEKVAEGVGGLLVLERAAKEGRLSPTPRSR